MDALFAFFRQIVDIASSLGLARIAEIIEKIIHPIIVILAFLGGIAAYIWVRIKKIRNLMVLPETIPQPYSDDFTVHPISSKEILAAVYAFDEENYGIPNITFAQFTSWWQAYPNGLLCAFRYKEPIAVIGIFPVTEDWARKFLVRKVSEFELFPEHIRNSRKKWWYISGISVKKKQKGLSRQLRYILCNALQVWFEMHAGQIGTGEITFVSEGVTDIGEHLLHHFRFDAVALATSEGEKPRFCKKVSVHQLQKYLTEHKLCANYVAPIMIERPPLLSEKAQQPIRSTP